MDEVIGSDQRDAAIRHYDVTPLGTCPNCGARIAGRFGAFGEPFGPRRIPVRMQAHA